jgi:hypothetical protein
LRVSISSSRERSLGLWRGSPQPARRPGTQSRSALPALHHQLTEQSDNEHTADTRGARMFSPHGVTRAARSRPAAERIQGQLPAGGRDAARPDRRDHLWRSPRYSSARAGFTCAPTTPPTSSGPGTSGAVALRAFQCETSRVDALTIDRIRSPATSGGPEHRFRCQPERQATACLSSARPWCRGERRTNQT